MSKPSSKYFDLVERWLLGGLPIQRMNMSPDRRFRALLAYEAYQIWIQDKQIRPADIMRRIAAREYPILLHKAEIGDETAKGYVAAMNVRAGVPRTITEISNDVALFNHLVGYFDTPTVNIERAKVSDASDWLIREGMKSGNAKSVKSGADLKMQLYDNFKQEETPAEQMPNMEINITGDVSVVKRDRVNYTDEEKKRLAKKYGLTVRQVVELTQQPDGSWQAADETDKEDDMGIQDVFDING